MHSPLEAHLVFLLSPSALGTHPMHHRYKPKNFILPLVLMLNGGGKAIEDIREIKIDEGLRELLCIKEMPSSDAFYAWLRRMGKGAKVWFFQWKGCLHLSLRQMRYFLE